ncbi:hypothetical protein GCM10007979_24570 [Nocardioides albus]|nr:hypothetical protein GCM10007979_24570 [Nocardioides albus]
MEPKWWITRAALTPASVAMERIEAPNPSRANRSTAASRIRSRVLWSAGAERMFNAKHVFSPDARGYPIN